MEEIKTRNGGFILIVEDDSGTSELEAQRLAPLGFNIRSAFTPEETLKALKAAQPELMVLDYSFPGMTALELVARLRKESVPVPPFIVVTGRGDEAVAVNSMKAGALDYIIKDSAFLDNLLPTAQKAMEKVELQAKLKRAEADLRKNLRLYNFLAQVNSAAASERDKEALFKSICSIAVSAGGFRMAWIGVPDKDTGRVFPVCSAGHVNGYLDSIKITLDDGPNGKGPTGTAVRTGSIAVAPDIAAAKEMAPWRAAAVERGYRSSATIPLLENGKPAAALTLYADEPHFFTGEEQKLLAEIEGDISLALKAISTEQERAAAQAALERTANQLSHVMEVTPVVIFTKRRKNGKLITEWVSGNAQAVIGYEPSEILAPGWMEENLHPLDKARALSFLSSLPEKGAAAHDFRFKKRNGAYFWVHNQLKISSLDSTEVTASWTDITPLKESELHFQELFEKAPVGYQSLDAQGNLLAINETWAKTFGYKPGEVIGRNFGEFLVPEQKKLFAERFPDFKSAGEMAGNEFDIICKDQSRRRLSFSGRIVYNRDGSVQKTHCVFTDITATWKTREQTALLSEAVRASFNEVYIFDPETFRFIFVNYGAVRNLGYSPEELENMAPWDLKTDLTETAFREKVAPLLSGETSQLLFENRYTRKNGTTYPVEVRLQMVDTGKKKVFLAVTNDITKRRAAQDQMLLNEARLESLARINSYEAKDDQDLLDFALNEAITLTSSRIGYIYHYDEDSKEFTLNTWSKDVMKDCSVQDQQTKYSLEKTGIWGEAVRQRKAIIINDFSAPDPLKKGLPRGHVPLTSFMTVPVFSGKSILGVVGVANKTGEYTAHDARQLTLLIDSVWKMTAKREASRTEQRMIYEMAAMQRMESLGQLAGGIAHDFNNMLTGIMANISLLKNRADCSPESSEILDETLEAAHNAQSLTTKLLSFSKGGKPVKTEFCMRKALEDIFNLATAGTAISHELLVPEDLWSVEGDENQIKQTVNNLLLNALQAMPSGGKLTLEARNAGRELHPPEPLSRGEYVRITVTDTGIGIPEKYLSKIFDPYFSTKSRGHGLGLSMAWSVTKNHGGHITVSSSPGKGSSFDIYLPATGRCLKAEAKKAPPIAKGSGRILVLEDEEIVSHALRRMLSELGYACEIVTDGKDAVARYAEEDKKGEPFAAVLMDLTIPGGRGGNWAVHELRKVCPAAKVIVSSGYSDDAGMADYKQNGFDAVLPKPYKYEDLAETLSQLLKK